jgi:hypothetical protein
LKVLITGSRTWNGTFGGWRIGLTLNRLQSLSLALESPLRLMNGACPEGADWIGLGKPAGFVRNQFMVNQGADMCVAFLRDGSRGTQHTIDRARAAGIPTFVVPWITSTTDVNDLPLTT